MLCVCVCVCMVSCVVFSFFFSFSSFLFFYMWLIFFARSFAYAHIFTNDTLLQVNKETRGVIIIIIMIEISCCSSGTSLTLIEILFCSITYLKRKKKNESATTAEWYWSACVERFPFFSPHRSPSTYWHLVLIGDGSVENFFLLLLLLFSLPHPSFFVLFVYVLSLFSFTIYIEMCMDVCTRVHIEAKHIATVKLMFECI